MKEPLFETTIEAHDRIQLLIKILTSFAASPSASPSNYSKASPSQSSLNILLTSKGIYLQLLSDTRICFNLIKIKREFFLRYHLDLQTSPYAINHEEFGNCYSLAVSKLDGVSVISLVDLSRLSIVLRSERDHIEDEEESLKLVFVARYANGVVKKLIVDDIPSISSNFKDLYELVLNIPRLDHTDLNYFNMDATNFEFLDMIPQSSLRQYDFEIATNGKIVRLRAFQPVIENDVLKQVSTHAISFRVKNLKRWQLIEHIRSNTNERDYFRWQVKLSFLKNSVLNFIKSLKLDFNIYFSEELNEILISFNHKNIVEFNTLLISFNDQFANILPIDRDEVDREVTVREQQEEKEQEERYDDYNYSPPSAPAHKQPIQKLQKQEQHQQSLFHQTQTNEDSTDEGTDNVQPTPLLQPQPQSQREKEREQEQEKDQHHEEEIQWNENFQAPKALTEEEIINNAKNKYLKEQERKRKLKEQREREKRQRKEKDKENDSPEFGPTQNVPLVKGLFD